MKNLSLSGLIVAFSLALLFCPPMSAEEPPATEKSTEELVRQLGSKDFRDREAAERELMKREDAIPALRRAAASSDLDLARRASRILDRLLEMISRREARQVLDKMGALAKNGEVDRVVEALVLHRDWGSEEDAAWQVLSDISKKLLDIEKRQFHKTRLGEPRAPGEPGPTDGNRFLPSEDVRLYKKVVRPVTLAARRRVTLRTGSYLIRAEEVTADSLTYSLVACTGPFQVADSIAGSAIFAGDSVEVSGAGLSVVVCDGEFKAPFGLNQSIIVARGDVWFPPIRKPNRPPRIATIRNSVIISGGKVHLPKGATVVNSVIKENQPAPLLGFVKFFETSQVGVEVVAAEGGVKVTKAHDDKPFARAGVRPGDIILTVGKAKAGSPETFRRLLRRKLAEGGELPLTVRRGDKELKIPVTCKE